MTEQVPNPAQGDEFVWMKLDDDVVSLNYRFGEFSLMDAFNFKSGEVVRLCENMDTGETVTYKENFEEQLPRMLEIAARELRKDGGADYTGTVNPRKPMHPCR